MLFFCFRMTRRRMRTLTTGRGERGERLLLMMTTPTEKRTTGRVMTTKRKRGDKHRNCRRYFCSDGRFNHNLYLQKLSGGHAKKAYFSTSCWKNQFLCLFFFNSSNFLQKKQLLHLLFMRGIELVPTMVHRDRWIKEAEKYVALRFKRTISASLL